MNSESLVQLYLEKEVSSTSSSFCKLYINVQVGWDESTAGERRSRVSIWEIEPVTAPFFICPPPFIRSKRPRLPGIPGKELFNTQLLVAK
jgi:hypothetical protein